MKSIFILLFIGNLALSQNYPLAKDTFNNFQLLDDKLKEIVITYNKNYKAKSNIDSLKFLAKQEIFIGNYIKALSTIDKYRNELAINNWEGNKLFSFEVFSKAKLIELDKKIEFEQALDITLKDKIDNLKINLLVNLKREILVDIEGYEKTKNENIESQKTKDSISGATVNQLLESILDVTIFKLVNDKALAVYEKKIAEKFTNETVEIKTSEGATLTAVIVRNKNQMNPQPAILTNNIYASDRDYVFGMRSAMNDYVGIVVNTRGKRNSKDINDPFEHESSDLYDIIDWVSKQKWCNGKVGMIGGSYLGFSQWAATKKLHPALKTIVPQASVGIGAMDFPMLNNVFRSYMLRWLSYVTNNNLTDEADFDDYTKWNAINNQYFTKGKKFNSLDSISGKKNIIFQRWLKHPSSDAYWQKMIPFKEEFSKINIPVLSTTGYYDADQTGVLHYFNQHNKYNKKAEHYLIIGPYDHPTVQTFPNNELYGYKLDSVAKVNFTNLCYEWFDYIFKEKPKPTILQNKINVQIMGTNQWRSVNTYKEISNNSVKFYLNRNKETKSIFEKPSKKSNFTQTVDFKIRNEKRKYYSTGKDSMTIGSGRMAIESEVLEKDIIINGSFTGNLRFSINKKDIDLAIDLIEVKPDGKIFYLSDYVGRASYAKDNTKRQLLKSNKIEQIPISNATFVSKKIEKGSKLVIVFGANKSRNWQVNYGSGKDVSEESIEDAGEPMQITWYNDSYIEIPVLK